MFVAIGCHTPSDHQIPNAAHLRLAKCIRASHLAVEDLSPVGRAVRLLFSITSPMIPKLVPFGMFAL